MSMEDSLKKALREPKIKRVDKVNPKEGEEKYGNDIEFADPVSKKYPLDTEAHVRAALSYWGQKANKDKYSKGRKEITDRIEKAAKKFGIS